MDHSLKSYLLSTLGFLNYFWECVGTIKRREYFNLKTSLSLENVIHFPHHNFPENEI